VEDDLKVQSTVVDTLSGLGYSVLKADGAEQALTVIRSGIHIDLLFTDVVMPGSLRSPDMAAQAVQLLPRLKVLFTSGYTQNAVIHGGRLDSGVELFCKPYSREQLAYKIRQNSRDS
jgi:CheY-like chemotaxis protein